MLWPNSPRLADEAMPDLGQKKAEQLVGTLGEVRHHLIGKFKDTKKETR